MNLNDYNIDAFIKQWRNLILKESMELDESKKKNYIVTLGDEKTGASEAVPIFASTPEDANRKA